MQIIRRDKPDGNEKVLGPNKHRGGRRIREAKERARRASREATPWLYESATFFDEVFGRVIRPESRGTALDPRDTALGLESEDVANKESAAPAPHFSPAPAQSWMCDAERLDLILEILDAGSVLL